MFFHRRKKDRIKETRFPLYDETIKSAQARKTGGKVLWKRAG
jgi:hypothetical protein